MGKKVIIETEDCVGCESCVELCPDVFSFDEEAGKAVVWEQACFLERDCQRMTETDAEVEKPVDPKPLSMERVRNISSISPKLHTLHAPPIHRDGLVHHTRDEAEAAMHVAANGTNALKEGKRISPLHIFLSRKIHRAWTIPGLAAKRFLLIDGTQWAGAFAFNAFFSLFPLMILLVTIVSSFVDKDLAGKAVIAYMESYVPISGEMQHLIFNGIAGVINSREQAGLVALLALVWTAIQCFTTLIVATNRAWGAEVYNWWRLPLKSLTLLGITAGAVLLGMAVPVLIQMAKVWLFPMVDFRPWLDNLVSFFIPSVVVFFGLSLFYRFIPSRPTRFTEVWAAALGATVLLRAAESFFIIYLKDFATLNAVYGAFGGIMALLLWVYVSGCIFIYGACLCAGQAEMRSVPEKTPIAQADKRDVP